MMFTPFDRKSPQPGKFRFLQNRKPLTLVLVLAALSSVLVAACNNDTSKKAATRPTPKAQQYLVWDTTPAAQILEGEVTPFLAKALLSKQTGQIPTCKPSYSLTKAGTADASISSNDKILEAIKPGSVTLTASCPADPQNSYPATSIDAKVEIVAKPRGNFQFGIYMDPIQAAWKKSALEATSNPLAIDHPSYSMYAYMTTVMTANNAAQTIKDATFLILNENPGAYTINYRLNKEAGSYLLLVSYKKTPSDSEDFFAVRVKEQLESNDKNLTYSIKNADDLLKMRWNLSGTYNITKSFAMPSVNAINYLPIADYKKDGWFPVASQAKPFQGTLDGHNFTIMGLVATSSFTPNNSLLGVLKTATVKNLKLSEAFVMGANSIGTLAGKAENVNLENIEAKGRTTGPTMDALVYGAESVGGLVGDVVNTDPSKTLKNLSVHGLLSGNYPVQSGVYAFKNTGGIFGTLTGNLESASYSGKILGRYSSGGIVGELKGKLSSVQVSDKSNIEGLERTGGIVGALESGEVNQAVSFAQLQGLSPVAADNFSMGGIAGSSKGSILRSYAWIGVSAGGSKVGGLVGLYEGTSSSSITDSYASVSWLEKSAPQIGGLVGAVTTPGALVIRRSFVTSWVGDQANAIVGDATGSNLQAVYFPGSLKGTGALAGSAAMVANSPSYDASFASYKNNGFWQLGDKANWPILINLPAELTPIAIQ